MSKNIFYFYSQAYLRHLLSLNPLTARYQIIILKYFKQGRIVLFFNDLIEIWLSFICFL